MAAMHSGETSLGWRKGAASIEMPQCVAGTMRRRGVLAHYSVTSAHSQGLETSQRVPPHIPRPLLGTPTAPFLKKAIDITGVLVYPDNCDEIFR